MIIQMPRVMRSATKILIDIVTDMIIWRRTTTVMTVQHLNYKRKTEITGVQNSWLFCWLGHKVCDTL